MSNEKSKIENNKIINNEQDIADTTKQTLERMEIFRNKKNRSELQIKLVSCGQFIGYDDPDRFIDYVNHLLSTYDFKDVQDAISLWVINSDFKKLGLDYLNSIR